MGKVFKAFLINSLFFTLFHFDGLSSEYVIGFGSCLHQDYPQPIWEQVKKQSPNLFIMLGDNVYGDTYGNIDNLNNAYQKQKLVLEKFKLDFPFLAIWDDHDFGKNDGGNEYIFKNSSKQLFLKYWKIPEDDNRYQRDGLYFEKILNFEHGTVQILILDTRYFRSSLLKNQNANKNGMEHYLPDYDLKKTMLGKIQWKWLIKALEREVDVRVIGTSIQLLAEGHRWERWGNFPNERKKLLKLFAKTSKNKAIVISGDRHLGGIYKFIDRNGATIYEITSSSMNMPSRIQHENGPLRIGDIYSQENFGIIRMNLKLKSVNIELHGLNDGLVRSEFIGLQN